MGFETEYAYDENNNRITQTDANEHTTTMAYDKQNRLISRTYHNGDQERFGYNANGSMIYKVAGNGDSTVYEYDNRNREVLRTYAGGHNVRTVYTPDSKRDSIVDYRGVTVYEYGECCSQLMKVINPDGTFLEYDYDDNKNKTGMTTPWRTIRYEYDLLNRMKYVISPDEDTTEYFYNAIGNRDSVYNSVNGTGTGYTFNVLNRLTKVTNYNNNGSNIISSYEYELNNAGIRTAIIELDGSRVDYGYDDLYRLTSETRIGSNAYSISYTYDNVGNRLTKNHDGVVTDYVYNNRDQLTTENSPLTTVSYIYDASGRQVSKTDAASVTYYKWVDNDRLDSVITPAKTISYIYDAEGSKVCMNDGSVNKNYLVDKLQPYAQVIAEYDDTQNLNAEYVFGVERIGQDRAGVGHIYIADGQGSIRQLTNDAGDVTDTYDYFAFGEILNKNGITENEFQYVGEQIDPNSGFYYLRARWMNPNIGRFVSVDPFGGNQQTPFSLHRYLYSNSSPISFNDPNGRFTTISVMATIAVTGIVAATSIPIIKHSPRIIKWVWYKTGKKTWDESELGQSVNNIVSETKTLSSILFLNSPPDGRGDAFAHCYASCEITKEHGVFIAYMLGETREVAGNILAFGNDLGLWTDGPTPGSNLMDSFNNQVGRSYGISDNYCSSCCRDATQTGGLWIIHEDEYLQPF